jgi:hypothetical protein
MRTPPSAAYRLFATIVALVVAAFAPSSVLAWGNKGHQVIALIAADRLTPAARAEVAALLGGDARDSMESASTWADYIRLSRPETAPWHYVNIEVSASGYNAATEAYFPKSSLAPLDESSSGYRL